jgi:pimeloyl-ACP methyl ester carboxylesterase
MRLLAVIGFVFGSCIAVCIDAEPTLAADRVGVVLMHGKTGTAATKSPVGRLAASLRRAGFLVSTPNMPWSRSRNVAKDYEGSMAEIDTAVAGLKKRDASKIVVGGHSMGGNAALGYGARREGLAGIMVIAPGHAPSRGGYQMSLGVDYKRAQQMVDSGRGKAVAKFWDNNQGKKRRVRLRADIYLSWFDMDGPASMPNNAASLKPGTALLWVIGKKDMMRLAGETFAFTRAPEHPHSLYLEVAGGHNLTPTIAAQQIIGWLKRL